MYGRLPSDFIFAKEKLHVLFPAMQNIFDSSKKKHDNTVLLYCNVLPLTVFFIGKLMY